MTHASLFSGIGGPEVAAAMMGWENAFHCEINPFGRAVLEYWFPNSKSYEDITKTDFREWRGKIDILTGGFPCQPFSYAGKRGGRDDERYLWPEMLRVIDEVRPAWVVGENVAGITTMVEGGVLTPMGSDLPLFGEGDGLHRFELRQSFTIERICRDLEGIGYSVQPVLVPAAAVGAPHRRDRVFIIAHSDERGGSPQGKDSAGDRPGADILPGKAGQREGHAPVWADGLSPVQGIAQDTVGDGCRLGEDDQQGRVGHVGHVGARDDERVCREKRISASDSDGGRQSASASEDRFYREEEVEGGECDAFAGTIRPRTSRSSSHSDLPGLQEERPELQAAGDRRGCEEDVADPYCGRLEGTGERTGEGRGDDVERYGGKNGESYASDTESERGRRLQGNPLGAQQDGATERMSGHDNRPCASRSFAHSHGQGREESQLTGRGEDSEEEGAGVDDRTERSGRNGVFADPELLPENRWRDFPTVSPVHRGDDGLPFSMGDLTLPPSKWRTEALKAYGNAIVPQVMYRIFQAIEEASK